MRRIVTAAILGLLPGVAHAEFVLEPAAPAAVARQPATARPVAPPRSAAAAAVPVAVGFGREVPLRFAVLQILPGGWTARYGAGIDQDRAVDWSGGKAWPDVLRAAVRPLGLRVTISGKTVAIDAGS